MYTIHEYVTCGPKLLHRRKAELTDARKGATHPQRQGLAGSHHRRDMAALKAWGGHWMGDESLMYT